MAEKNWNHFHTDISVRGQSASIDFSDSSILCFPAYKSGLAYRIQKEKMFSNMEFKPDGVISLYLAVKAQLTTGTSSNRK